jgi:hypothetical protein
VIAGTARVGLAAIARAMADSFILASRWNSEGLVAVNAILLVRITTVEP